jgi:N-methylhydantoinase B
MAREIFQEGLRIPPILLVRRGKIDQALLRLILANVRTPEEREGDLLAQWMAIHRGQLRLLELVDRYGLPTVDRNMSRLQQYSERMMRAAIRKLPDGIYRFEDFLDGDGDSTDPVRIVAAIDIAGDSATVDFTGTSPQVSGPLNANYAIAISAATYAFRCLIREEVPFTAGLMRPVRVIAPAGTVVNALPPAAMAAGNVETSQRITDVLLGALSQAAPDRIPAASSGTMNNLTFGGWDPFRGRAFAYYETIAGGMGAGPWNDGQSAVHTHMTNSWNTPVEAFEHQYPVRIRRYGIRPDSGGAGERTGGDGVVRTFEFLTPADVTILSSRRALGPYGLQGGMPGMPGRNTLLRNNRRTPIAAMAQVKVEPGDLLEIESPGGGGFGIMRDCPTQR